MAKPRASLNSPRQVTQLGSKSQLTPAQIETPQTILEVFDNPRLGRPYQIEFIFPEFTSMCPVTGQPDFATITLRYVPGKYCVEMKSLKLYYLAYRNKGIFYEGVVNTICDDLVSVLSPQKLTVIGTFNARGGTVGIITVEHDGKSSRLGRIPAK